jgi:hypothetical protein
MFSLGLFKESAAIMASLLFLSKFSFTRKLLIAAVCAWLKNPVKHSESKSKIRFIR